MVDLRTSALPTPAMGLEMTRAGIEITLGEVEVPVARSAGGFHTEHARSQEGRDFMLTELPCALGSDLELLQFHRWTADAFGLECDVDLNAVGDLDEGDPAVHSKFLAVEGHAPLDLSLAGTNPGDRKRQRLRLGNAPMVKTPGTSKVLAPVCTIFVDLNVMYGSDWASKKSLLFSLSSFMPLPVFTEAA